MNPEDNQDTPSNGTTGVSPDATLFDVRQLQELMGGDKAFVEELIMLYLEEVPQRMSRFLEHCEQENTHTARLEIHSIKGSSATIGAKRMSEVAWEIEQRLRQNEPVASIQDFIAPLQTTFNDTEAAMKTALTNL